MKDDARDVAIKQYIEADGGIIGARIRVEHILGICAFDRKICAILREALPTLSNDQLQAAFLYAVGKLGGERAMSMPAIFQSWKPFVWKDPATWPDDFLLAEYQKAKVELKSGQLAPSDRLKMSDFIEFLQPEMDRRNLGGE